MERVRFHRHSARFALTALVAAATFGCAPKQKIPLDCVPREVDVYVDGELLDEIPPELSLRSDEPHTLFIKGVGIEPELVVLDNEEIDGRWMLSPSAVCFQPRLLGARRELEIEIDPDVSAAPPSDRDDAETTVDVERRPEFAPAVK